MPEFPLTQTISLHSTHTRPPATAMILNQSQNGKFLSCWIHSRTAGGLNKLPVWFLRVGAPIFYKPVTRLFSKSIDTSTVLPVESACVVSISKTATPQHNVEYRPTSCITPVLRLLERAIVSSYLYPAIIVPPASLYFTHQYAVKPTGSTAAALIALLISIIEQLATNPYVVVLTVDFSKAFDTARHTALFQKIGSLDIPDTVYN